MVWCLALVGEVAKYRMARSVKMSNPAGGDGVDMRCPNTPKTPHILNIEPLYPHEPLSAFGPVVSSPPPPPAKPPPGLSDSGICHRGICGPPVGKYVLRYRYFALFRGGEGGRGAGGSLV